MSVLTNAQKLYLEGIGEGDYETAIDKYSGKEYVQHSTGVKTGQDGFKQFFADFTTRNPKRKMKIVHSIEEGNLAFLFVVQALNGIDRWVTMDIFAGDENNKLVEHWDVIEAFEQPINHHFKFEQNSYDLKQIVSANINTFKHFISEVSDLNYDFEEHKLYQIVRQDNYVAMLSGFNHNSKPYAQISLLEFERQRLCGFWSTTEVINLSDMTNSGKF